MNKSILSVLLLIGLSSVLTACNKSVNTSVPVGTMDAMVTANEWEVGGSWNSKAALASTMYATTNYGFTQMLIIQASKTSGTTNGGSIVLTIANFKDTLGTFAIDNVNNIASYVHGSDTLAYPAIYGSVTITSGSAHNALGYFSFTCKDSTKVTNGVFNVVMK